MTQQQEDLSVNRTLTYALPCATNPYMETTTKEQTVKYEGLSDKEWDDLYCAIVAGDDRAVAVARFGEDAVTFAENHPVIRAAITYRNR